MRTCVVAIVVLWTCLVSVAADDWPAPSVHVVFSASGERFVRIIPGSSTGDVIGFSGAPKGPFARGEFYKRDPDRSYRLVADVVLKNPVGPTDAMLTNAGYLVTFDNWHNFGYGVVVGIYSPAGALVRGVSLEQLYPADRVSKIPTSVSSRWWRCAPHGFVDPATQTKIYVPEQFGGMFVFTLNDGSFEYHPGQAKCEPPAGPFSASWFGR